MRLIYLDDAIEAITSRDETDGTYNVFSGRQVIDILKGLPSAQPEIIHCRDCKHHWTHRCMDSMPTEICDLNQTFYDPNIDFCSLAERRTDE